MPAYVRLTPEQREALDREIARLVGWVGRWLGLPWWGTMLAMLGVVGAAAAVYVGWDRIADRLRR